MNLVIQKFNTCLSLGFFRNIEEQIKVVGASDIKKYCWANVLESAVAYNTDVWIESHRSNLETLVIFYDFAVEKIEKSQKNDESKYNTVLEHIISKNTTDRLRTLLYKKAE